MTALKKVFVLYRPGWFRRKMSVMTIKTRLLLSSLALVFFISVIFISLSTIVGIKNGERQAYERLESVATLK
ncbi:MAG: hypothetical protein LLG42_10685, partial [Chloroflexi bacterium]|nr:hypothetical protein [Chloroflexota bacterium]